MKYLSWLIALTAFIFFLGIPALAVILMAIWIIRH